MALITEFKSFINRDNVVDLAVGVVIGAAFGKIVSSLVNDIVMPPIGMLLSGVNFSEIKFFLKKSSLDAAGNLIPPVTINVGSFIQVLIEFLIIAFVIFMVVKFLNRMKKSDEALPAEPALTKDQQLLQEIRDLLKK